MHQTALWLRCICSPPAVHCATVHATMQYTVQSIMQSTVHSLQSTVLIHSVRHWQQQQKMFAFWRDGCQLIPIPILLLKMWQAWAIACFRMREGVSMAIYISVTYIQSPPKFPITAWPYWPPGAVTQQRSDLYNSQIFTAALLVKNSENVNFVSISHGTFTKLRHHEDSKMCSDIVEVNGFRGHLPTPNWINAHVQAVNIHVYILCVFYIYMFILGPEVSVMCVGTGSWRHSWILARVQGRTRRCLTQVNRHHQHQSHRARRGQEGPWGGALRQMDLS